MKKIFLIIAGLSLIMSACKDEEVAVFSSNDSGVYFQYLQSYTLNGVSETYNDSITYSFASEKATTMSKRLGVTVRTLGKTYDYDRKVKVVVDEERSTAIEGVHYEIDLDTVRVKKGNSSVYVYVNFLRAPDLLSKSVKLTLKLEANDDFDLSLPSYKNTNVYTATGRQLDGTRFSFVVSESYTKPWYWDFFGDDYFGPWNPKKYLVVNGACGWTVQDWNNAGSSGSKVSYGRLGFAGRLVQKYLQEQADAGTPILDEDGSYMQLGPYNLVDYSRYE